MARWVLLAMSIGACGGQRNPSTEPPVAPPPTAPPVVAVAPPPAEDAGAPASDAGAPPPPPAAGSDAGVQTFSSDDLSPPVRALGAIARTNPSNPFEAGKRHVILLRAPPLPEHCNIAGGDPDYIMSSCTYEPHTCSSANFSVIAGRAKSYRVRLEVLSAPDKKGARGKLRIVEADNMNVLGGEIDVLVCD
jgi:hypothetical protein